MSSVSGHPALKIVLQRKKDGKITVNEAARINHVITSQLADSLKQGDKHSPTGDYIVMLESMKDEEMMTAFFQEVMDDTKRAKEDEKFYEDIKILHQACIDYRNQVLPESDYNKSVDVEKLARTSGLTASSAVAAVNTEFTSSLVTLADSNLPNLIRILESNSLSLAKSVGGRMASWSRAMTPYAGQIVGVALVGAYLTYEAIRNLWRWWKGEISGKRCAKNVIDAIGTTGAGVAGAAAGAAIGAVGGPVGIGIGTVIGAVLTTTVASKLIDHLTDWMFNLPKTEALEKAYNFLGVNKSAPNGEINKAFRKLALTCHPDKKELGGSYEKWTQLQCSMQAIRMSRDEK